MLLAERSSTPIARTLTHLGQTQLICTHGSAIASLFSHRHRVCGNRLLFHLEAVCDIIQDAVISAK